MNDVLEKLLANFGLRDAVDLKQELRTLIEAEKRAAKQEFAEQVKAIEIEPNPDEYGYTGRRFFSMGEIYGDKIDALLGKAEKERP